jgi:tryptophanyl-tRNA synthetase
MSKSDLDPHASVFLTDSDAEITKKFKRAVTDSGSEIYWSEEKPGIQNLLSIQSTLTGKSIDTLVSDYAGKQYGHLKVDTAELAVELIKPIRNKADDLMKNQDYLLSVLKTGADKARPRAQKTLKAVYEAVGFINK